MSRRRVKLVEKTGTQLQQILTKPDLLGSTVGSRADCLVCPASKDGLSRCRDTNLVYENTCRLCLAKGTTKKYIGETARSGYRRSTEHLGDLQSKSVESHMLSHIEEPHRGEELNLSSAMEVAKTFEFKILQKHPSSMKRHITEAVKIRLAGDSALNRSTLGEQYQP